MPPPNRRHFRELILLHEALNKHWAHKIPYRHTLMHVKNPKWKHAAQIWYDLGWRATTKRRIYRTRWSSADRMLRWG